MKKEENRKTACEAKQEENFSLCGNSGNQSLSAENAGEEKSNAGEKKRNRGKPGVKTFLWKQKKNNRLRHNFGKKSAGKGGVLKKS